MSTDRWQLLSEWHNAWLVAGADANATACGVNSSNAIRTWRRRLTRWRRLAQGCRASSKRLRSRSPPAISPRMTRCWTSIRVSDRIEFVGLMARGGMGDVYRATDVRLQRDVALKLLAHAGTDDTQRIERFLQEARVTAALDHANIVKVFDVGVLDGRPYLVAELLDGETLRARLGRGPLAVEEATGLPAPSPPVLSRACGRPGSPRFETGQCLSDAIGRDQDS